MSKKKRAKGMEECPGCVAVDIDGEKCSPGNARICLISWWAAKEARRQTSAHAVAGGDGGSGKDKKS